MSLDYRGSGTIKLYEGSSEVPVRWDFAACSSATANDGSLPYGTTIASAALTVYDSASVDRSAQMVEGAAVTVGGTGLFVTGSLNYPAADAGPPAYDEGPEGVYTLYLALTLSTGAVLVFAGPPVLVSNVP